METLGIQWIGRTWSKSPTSVAGLLQTRGISGGGGISQDALDMLRIYRLKSFGGFLKWRYP